MRKEYYYLVSGLPDLFIDASKVSSPVKEFKDHLKQELTRDDFSVIESYFYRYDNQNLLSFLQKKEEAFTAKANLNTEDFETILTHIKEETPEKIPDTIPSYFTKFIIAFKEDVAIIPNKSWENQLTEIYYEYLLSLNNEFIRNWYSFERDLNNILTAHNCRKYQISIEPELIGSSEFTEKLAKSSAKDFGLGNEFPKIDEILRTFDENNLLEREKKIDLIKWDFLNEATFFHYFTIERIFAYVQKLDIIERWIGLNKETGQMLFDKLLKEMETSQKFPEEFS